MDAFNRTEEFVGHLGKAQSRVYSFILSLVHDCNEADEIFQETNLVLWRKFSEFDPSTDFVRWACRVAYLEVLKRRSWNQKQVFLTDDLLATLAEETIADTDVFDAKRKALEHCLGRLQTSDRELMQLRYNSGESVPLVAEHIGRSLSAVYKAINRVHWQLLDCIRRRLATEDSE